MIEQLVLITVAAVVGGLVGGGSIVMLARKALTETLRETFATREQAVTWEALEKREDERETKRTEMFEKLEVRLRTVFHTELGTQGNHQARALEMVQRELSAMSKGVTEALKQSTDADRRTLVTEGKINVLEAKSVAQEQRIGDRLQHIEHLLGLLTKREVA